MREREREREGGGRRDQREVKEREMGEEYIKQGIFRV